MTHICLYTHRDPILNMCPMIHTCLYTHMPLHTHRPYLKHDGRQRPVHGPHASTHTEVCIIHREGEEEEREIGRKRERGGERKKEREMHHTL